jgi:putative hydroxymethylpyrimidine transport system permease protein
MRKSSHALTTCGLVVAILVLWEIVPRIFNIPTFILTPFSDVIATMVREWPDSLGSATATTVTEMLVGIAIAFIASMIVAIVLNSFAVIRQLVYPLLVASQAIPVIVIAPIFAIILGYGISSKIIVVIIQCFFPITVSFLTGLSNVEGAKLDLMKTLYGRRWTSFIRLELPSALPYLFSGLRVSVSYAPVAALFAEYTGSQNGLGYLMIQAIPQMQTSLVWAEVLILTALSLALFGIVVLLERLFCPWAKQV